jgi:hypothetical protein
VMFTLTLRPTTQGPFDWPENVRRFWKIGAKHGRLSGRHLSFKSLFQKLFVSNLVTESKRKLKQHEKISSFAKPRFGFKYLVLLLFLFILKCKSCFCFVLTFCLVFNCKLNCKYKSSELLLVLIHILQLSFIVFFHQIFWIGKRDYHSMSINGQN